MADSARVSKPALFVDGLCPDLDATKQRKSLGGDGRKTCQTADIDAKLPERPSLEGYKVEMLSLDQAMHLFRNFAKLRAYLAGLHRAGGPHA